MSLSREISRKGKASGKPFHLEKAYSAQMLRPSAGCSDSYHKYMLVWFTARVSKVSAWGRINSVSNTDRISHKTSPRNVLTNA